MRRAPAVSRGFTLIELVITISVLALLAGIAIPAYQDYVQRGRRSEAMSQLVEIANRQEQFYSDGNFRYTGTLSVLSFDTTSLPGGYYRLSIPTATTGSYTLRADAQGTQADDTNCARYEIDSQNRRRSYTTGGSTETTATERCWPN